ncbi:large conductance mechanosensitive channel protein MscL [Herbiconiux sp. CPCC 203407]|uniref:Large-conductance mechanosensitive channel n=1 Tax=Herbiconiux oxytropis TaxID=2970915 RepID=A0AA41XDX3_9MICO|nr:large conductance mechanosensitive channel protein MscL [Herbiconiux oxytropis]MCS5721041.1 large conductance mechanosensitive channel protein MscL [Herbiconiux oxytropis]MCS5724693.1 large conductance mechanosensitive channel protein MscL [Herbiconiux oxytropis]
MLKGFKEFILRGNVIDLAVAVVIGAAFTGVVNSIVNNIFNPLIASIFRASDLENVAVWTLNGSDIKFGAVLGALIQFLLVAVVVYFVFVLPINHLKKAAFAIKKTPAESLQEKNEELPPTETELLIQIRDLLANERAAAAGEPPATGHAPKH